MLIDILIPTYNRSVDLIKNLQHLSTQIENAGLKNEVQILISDNCSPDSTQFDVADFIASEFSVEISIQYFRTPENIGLEGNAINVLSKATSEFVLWTGDDDYLAEGYLAYLVRLITERPSIGCVIPGLASLYADGSVVPARCEEFDEQFVERGFGGAWLYSHLAHQMSGLLLKRHGLLDSYLSNPGYRNPYLFIYFVANRMLSYDAIYAPCYRTQVTVFNQKDWGYNSVGLLDEVYKNYNAMTDRLSHREIYALSLRFTTVHSYRLAFRPYKFRVLIRQFEILTTLGGCGIEFKLRLGILFFKESLLCLAGK
jgi:glycosyltransferase involved in cell wall biosynthesis